jgi:hypothetical protein
MSRVFLAVIFLPIVLISGCAKPDKVATFKSPVDGVFYTVETYYAHTPVSDTTRVYAHFERNGKKAKMLVLEGSDLTVARIIWNSPRDVTFCIKSGDTNAFRNYVMLDIGDTPDDSITIHTDLQEHCDAR